MSSLKSTDWFEESMRHFDEHTFWNACIDAHWLASESLRDSWYALFMYEFFKK